MPELALSMQGVQRTLGDFALELDRLELERGYVLGLLGPNGAGKSTTIRILLNLVYPHAGRVEVLGLRQPESEIHIKRRVGYVSENPSFYDDMTVEWTARLVGRCYPTWDDREFARYLSRFALSRQKRVKELSRGMKVKLALALALSHRPELLILDEPTSGIDPIVRRELLEEIVDLVSGGRATVLLSSHLTHDVEQVADFVAIMNDGRITEMSDKESLLERWRKVTGTARTIDSLKPLFRTFKHDGAAFWGVTDRFSDQWLGRLSAAGAGSVKQVRMNLDEILVTVVGKEIWRC